VRKQNDEVICTNAAELARAAAAAAVAFFCYLNFPMRDEPDATAADDTMLRFTALVILSLLEEENREAIEAELSASGLGVTTSHIRWLMHYLQGELLYYISQARARAALAVFLRNLRKRGGGSGCRRRRAARGAGGGARRPVASRASPSTRTPRM